MNIELKNVSKSFEEERPLLRDASLSFERGLTAVCGPSGSGKTTLARLIMGEEASDGGSVLVDGFSPRSYGEKIYRLISYVPVDPPVFGMLSVEDNLALFVGDASKRKAYLSALGLLAFRKRKAAFLSKGEAARLAILMGLSRPGDALLLDEPTANLDEENAELVFSLLAEAAKSKPVIVLTHDEKRATAFSDRAYLLKEGKFTLLSQKERLDEKRRETKEETTSSRGRTLWPYFKMGFKIALRKPLAYGISSFLLFLSLAVSSFGCTLLSSDPEATAKEAFALPEYSHLSIDFDNAELSASYGSPRGLMDAYHGEVLPLRTLYVKGSSSSYLEALAVEETPAREMDFLSSETDGSPLSIKEKTGAFSIVDSLEVETLAPETFLNHLSKKTGRSYQEGDSLPLSFDEEVSFVAIDFVLKGTYERDFNAKDDSSSFQEEAPLILPDGAYERIASARGLTLEGFGFGAGDLEDSLSSYEEVNHLEAQIPYVTSLLQRPYLGRDGLGLPFFEEGDALDPKEPLVLYVGELPDESGELMVPDRSLYNFFAEALEGPFAPYFEENGTAFAVDLPFLDTDEARIVGYYTILGPAIVDENGNYVMDDFNTPKRPYVYPDEAPVLLCPADYEKAVSYYVDDGWGVTGLESCFLVKGPFLSEHLSDFGLLSGEGPATNIGNRFDYAMPFTYSRLFGFLSTLVLFAVGLAGFLTSFIYLLRSAKESAAERELLIAMGQGKDGLLLSLGASLFLAIPPLLVGLPVGLAAAAFFAASLVTPTFPLPMVVYYPLGILLALLLDALLVGLFFLASNSWRKKNA